MSPTPEKVETSKSAFVNEFLIEDEQPKVVKKPTPNVGKIPEPKPKIEEKKEE